MDATKDSNGPARADAGSTLAPVDGERRLVITQGDPAGIGLELCLRAAATGRLRKGDTLVLARGHLDAATAALAANQSANQAANQAAAHEGPAPQWLQRGRAQLEPLLDAGLPHDAGQYAALVRGVDLVLEGGAGQGSEPAVARELALVTAPIDKSVAASEGLSTPGHTEYLAARAGVKDFAMAMIGARLRLTLATIHLPLAQVPVQLATADVVRAGRLLALALRDDLGIVAPRIAVCGLNPHAGEGGLLGHEDMQVVAPGVEALRAALPWASFAGPLPADAAFPLHAQGRFDGVVAMYHDQGLAPFKLMHFSDGVNMTLGLPFVRTSPDHGTAKDIAGKGRADPSSFFEAIRLARGGPLRNETLARRA